MSVNLKGRSFLTLKDFSAEEILYLLDLAADLKSKKRAGILGETLRGKNIVLMFDKTSTRTRCSFEVAARDEGAGVTYLDKNGSEMILTADEVLVATGRRANIASLLDESVGVETFRGVKSDENGKTNIDNIYVIGDARDGNIQLAHVAECQGENIIDLILGKEPEIDMSIIPSGIYTDPEIAAVGVREDELKEKGIAYTAKKALAGANGRCLIENSESGFVKLLIADDRIVGASIVAPHATELISELAVAVERGLSVKELAAIVHPHPTISEMIRDAIK